MSYSIPIARKRCGISEDNNQEPHVTGAARKTVAYEFRRNNGKIATSNKQ